MLQKNSTSNTNQSKTFADFGVSSKVANYFPIRFEFVNKISFFCAQGASGSVSVLVFLCALASSS
jgi:hypothetical protein